MRLLRRGFPHRAEESPGSGERRLAQGAPQGAEPGCAPEDPSCWVWVVLINWVRSRGAQQQLTTPNTAEDQTPRDVRAVLGPFWCWQRCVGIPRVLKVAVAVSQSELLPPKPAASLPKVSGRRGSVLFVKQARREEGFAQPRGRRSAGEGGGRLPARPQKRWHR